MALTKSGELLKTARLKKNLTLEDVERATKIREKFLRGLEEGDVAVFHSIAYARGFLKNYSDYLGVDTKIILALFRRETSTQAVKVIPQGMVTNENAWFRITPTRAGIAVALLILLAIGYYLLEEYRGFLGAPTLAIEKPKEEEVVREGEIEVMGKADIDATVLINGEPVTLSETGQFKKTIQVFKGETTLTVIARNRRGKETTFTRHITVE